MGRVEFVQGIDGDSKAAEVEFFGSDWNPQDNIEARIMISGSAAAIVEITFDSGSNWMKINNGVALAADTIYCFNFPVKTGDAINWRTVSGSATVTYDIMRVYRIPN